MHSFIHQPIASINSQCYQEIKAKETSDKMRQWNNVTDEWLEVDRGGRGNKRTRDRMCAGADEHKYVQMLVCTCVFILATAI